MTTVATIAADLILKADKYLAGMKQAGQAADSFDAKMKRVGQSMQKIGATMTIGLTVPIVAFGVASVKSAMEAEAAMADLNAVIESTGGIAGVTAKAAEDYADKMQMLTKFSDEEIIAGEAMLLTFTKIGKDVFPDASDAALDMAQKFGMDIPQAAITLGKALNDPISGVTALRRIGVMLTDQQEEQIKKFMEVGDVASAQKIILKELSVEIGGVAEAYGKTAGGQMAIFNNQLDELREVLGAAIIPTLISFMQALTPIIQKIADAPPWVQKLIIGFLLLVAAAGPLISIFGTLLTIIAAFGPGGALAGVATFITATLIPALSALFTFISTVAIPAIVAFTIANAAWIVPLLLVAATAYLAYLAFKNNFGGIATTVKQLWFIIKTVFSGIVNAIKTVIKATLEMMRVFLGVKLPPALTPGSPTPFEIGLVGIGKAMDNLSKKNMPKLSVGMGMMGANNRGNVTITDNRRFSAGMGAKELKIALDNKLSGIADNI